MRTDFVVKAIASELNLFTFQGVVEWNKTWIVPNLSGQLMRVSADGTTQTLADLTGGFGSAFGLTHDQTDLIVTVSSDESGGRLVRVKPDGSFATIVDLSEASGGFGAPFDVAMWGNNYVVAIATDVAQSQGCLVQVTPAGEVSLLAELSKFGTPFGVATDGNRIVTVVDRGEVIQVQADGKLVPLTNLVAAGLGIPLGVTMAKHDPIVTTNAGWLVQIEDQGKITPLTNLVEAGMGIPSGVTVSQTGYLVTTNAGQLIRVEPRQS